MTLADDLHRALRPASCGRKANTRAYLRWLTREQQLWRRTVYCTEPLPPPSPIVLDRSSHKTPPRKTDKVVVGGRFGVIYFIDYDSEEACVNFYDGKEPDRMHFDLSLFEANRGRIRWRVEYAW